MKRLEPEPLALTVISGWEFIALTTGKIPTITSKVRPLPWLARLAVVAGCGVFLARHFKVF